MASQMIDESTESEYVDYIDYTAQLDDIYYRLDELTESTAVIEENTANLAYLPHIYQNTALLLGIVIVFILFRFVMGFISSVFNDTTKL